MLHGVAAAAKPGVTGAALYDLAQELAGGHEGFMGGRRRARHVRRRTGSGSRSTSCRSWRAAGTKPFEADMVFALEPKFVFPGEAAIGIENSYLVDRERRRRRSDDRRPRSSSSSAMRAAGVRVGASACSARKRGQAARPRPRRAHRPPAEARIFSPARPRR